MISVTYNGKPFKTGDFEKDMKRKMRDIVATEMQERIGSIRDPNTGEFPVVVVRGHQLEDMRLAVEASQQLIAIIRDRLPLEEIAMIDFTEIEQVVSPKAFLSYASEDREIAQRVAEGIQAAGVETWWDRWEIGAGDSIVQKINQGLDGCTHFIVLLSPNSINKPWVQTEIDAGFVRRVHGEAKFIPLRCNILAEQLPPLLRALHSPALSETPEKEIEQLISDIYQLTRKPKLGAKPSVAEQPPSPYSSAAMAVAEYFCRETTNAVWADPQIIEEDLATAVGLSLEDTKDALYELRDFFRESHFSVLPDKGLWTEFDRYFLDGADPQADALTIAADMMNSPNFPNKISEIAELYEWVPRRLNPAVAYLIDRNLVRDIHYLGDGRWVTSEIERTDATRRFVKSRS
ncbi:toll/interleukin-1 receptor domain-containing protein [Donghicola eburneus]|uniref:toll/interleukin-1 receptor domain-containing protein n=1 Tax=Donghicola eburneus TaxID=393278 RepID=UPI0008E73569|nr:toll/interleukin-1 receptor domain-containing protein [Donghicola eburneus]SFQ78252.1 TIR domain-containing protein [Donghicola eburneus]